MLYFMAIAISMTVGFAFGYASAGFGLDRRPAAQKSPKHAPILQGQRWIFRGEVVDIEDVYVLTERVTIKFQHAQNAGVWPQYTYIPSKVIAFEVLRAEGFPYTDAAWRDCQDMKIAQDQADRELKTLGVVAL